MAHSMIHPTPPRALIAEDEPLLAANLQAELARAWPALEIVANVAHGAAAVEQTLALRPDLVFLDIRMPGMNGLDAAQAIAEDWPAGAALPLLVFVTAFDQYAVTAFERAAIDYVLKPIRPDRLALTCARVQAALRERDAVAAQGLDATLAQLRSLLAVAGLAAQARGAQIAPGAPGASVTSPRQLLQASVGATIHMIAVADVLYFEAADKYVRVVTAGREYLIRTSLRELLPQLDSTQFWQVHRGTVVRADAIATATRDDSGKVALTLRGHPDTLLASRLHAHLFKAM